ncbi:MAG: hypothetical protein C4526_04990 [Nitrospiraceae bacterium]|nr:MAG: hypothetical protein C4526_04990 [Nitrospiraceae bacterium]
MMQYGLIFAGLSSIALGIFHIPQIWGTIFTQWNTEMNGLSLLSRKLINTVLVALGLTLIILGVATLLLIKENPAYYAVLGWFLVFCFIFWTWRLAWQIMYFPYRKLNPGRQLLVLHIFLIVIFLFNTIAYLAPLIIVLPIGILKH